MLKKILITISFTCFSLAFQTTCIGQHGPQWSHFEAEIFEKAKKENKLVLLHLRANWCHWCHVMEEKTYTEPEVISFLEKNYIACMEDHDERQDLTSLYSDYGWPATIIFDSNGNELFKEAGYIPVDDFLTTLKKLKENPEPLSQNNSTVIIQSASDSVKQASLNELTRMFKNSLDIDAGGFVFGQKYIEFATFEFALRHYTKEPELEKWLTASVKNATGIFDTVWGGVFQYSTHNDWNHVHFEKLLAIQARYMKMYCWYYQLFGDKEALRKAEHISVYADRFLASRKGGYCNAQDADLVPGQKSKEYFDLNDAERIKKGIPAVDTSVYTNENAAYAESLFILWAASGKQTYYGKAIACVDFLRTQRKYKTLYKHGSKYIPAISLNDNLAMVKTLMLAYRATQKEIYKTEAGLLIKEINASFNSGKGYYYAYVGNSAIKATYNITENTEACRLLNYCSHFFHDTTYKKSAELVFNFLTSSELVNTLSTEPGILSASEEIVSEPVNAAFMLKKDDALKADYIRSTIALPYFYFNSIVYTKENMVEDKKYLFEAFTTNFMVLCTSSYCSSPIATIRDFREFLYRRVLETR